MTGLQVAIIGVVAPVILAAIVVFLGRQLEIVIAMLRGK